MDILAHMALVAAAGAFAFFRLRWLGINGWLRAIVCAEVAVVVITDTARLLGVSNYVLSDQTYTWIWLAASGPLWVLILTQALYWWWEMAWLFRGITLFAAMLIAGLVCGLSDPSILLVEFSVLSGAGLLAASAPAYLQPPQRQIAGVLGALWCARGYLSVIYISGFGSGLNTWAGIVEWLPAVVVAVGLVALGLVAGQGNIERAVAHHKSLLYAGQKSD